MASSVPVVSAAEAHALLPAAATYLDVRTPREFKEGHAPGALNAPVFVEDANGNMAPDPTAFRAAVAEKVPAKDASLVVACRSGKRSTAALDLLVDMGYTQLRHMSGGWNEWTAAGLPSTTEPSK